AGYKESPRRGFGRPRRTRVKGAPFVLFVLLGLGSLAVGLYPPRVVPSAPGERQIVDMADRKVGLVTNPHRVVIFPYVLAQLVTVQLGAANVAGASRIAADDVADGILSDSYPQLRNVPILAKGVSPQDPELILQAAPDAAIVWSDDVRRLERLGIPGVLARA